MRNFWEAFQAKIGGKQLFDKINEHNLTRNIRLIVVAALQTHPDTKFVITLEKDAQARKEYKDMIDLYIWARHLPPWWARAYAQAVRDILAMNNEPLLNMVNVYATMSQTPVRKVIDRHFPKPFPRVIGVKHNREKVIEFCKENEIRRDNIPEDGFQPANGLLYTHQYGVLHLPRRCYDIIPNSEAKPEKHHHVSI